MYLLHWGGNDIGSSNAGVEIDSGIQVDEDLNE